MDDNGVTDLLDEVWNDTNNGIFTDWLGRNGYLDSYAYNEDINGAQEAAREEFLESNDNLMAIKWLMDKYDALPDATKTFIRLKFGAK